MTEIWIDTRTGDQLIGEAAISYRQEESSPGDLVPLYELLDPNSGITFDHTDDEKESMRSWEQSDYKVFGMWVLKLLESSSERKPHLTSKVLSRLYELGIGPHYNDYFQRGGFDNLAEFQEVIGAPITYSPKGRFDHWTTKDFIDYARTVEASVGGKPTKQDYATAAEQSVDAPSLYVINQRMSIRELNEDLGYPDTRAWEDDDYIDYGVRVAEVNGIGAISIVPLQVLSARKRGAGYARIVVRFNDSIDEYRSRVIERLQKKAEAKRAKASGYREKVKNGQLPTVYADLPDEQLIQQAAGYELIKHMAPHTSNDRIIKIAATTGTKKFMTSINGLRESITPGDVEIEADILGVYDDIWPLDYSYLKVSEDDVTRQRQKRQGKLAA